MSPAWRPPLRAWTKTTCLGAKYCLPLPIPFWPQLVFYVKNMLMPGSVYYSHISPQHSHL